MSKLDFSTGQREYTINDRVTVVFNPTDAAFCDRAFRLFSEMDKIQDSYAEKARSADDNDDVFTRVAETDAALREKLDQVFDAPICDDVFGAMTVTALADGVPVWVNLMFAVLDEIDGAFDRERKTRNPRIEKYTKKYKKSAQK